MGIILPIQKKKKKKKKTTVKTLTMTARSYIQM